MNDDESFDCFNSLMFQSVFEEQSLDTTQENTPKTHKSAEIFHPEENTLKRYQSEDSQRDDLKSEVTTQADELSVLKTSISLIFHDENQNDSGENFEQIVDNSVEEEYYLQEKQDKASMLQHLNDIWN